MCTSRHLAFSMSNVGNGRVWLLLLLSTTLSRGPVPLLSIRMNAVSGAQGVVRRRATSAPQSETHVQDPKHSRGLAQSSQAVTLRIKGPRILELGIINYASFYKVCKQTPKHDSCRRRRRPCAKIALEAILLRRPRVVCARKRRSCTSQSVGYTQGYWRKGNVPISPLLYSSIICWMVPYAPPTRKKQPSRIKNQWNQYATCWAGVPLRQLP